jgi:coproporphyrinogen III oxidase-like Fe-S oxidoreductase
MGMSRWHNVCDYRGYIDRLFAGRLPSKANENLTSDIKRIERIALLLRTREGIAGSGLEGFSQQMAELVSLGLLRKSNDNFLLTRKGESLADSVAEAFL